MLSPPCRIVMPSMASALVLRSGTIGVPKPSFAVTSELGRVITARSKTAARRDNVCGCLRTARRRAWCSRACAACAASARAARSTRSRIRPWAGADRPYGADSGAAPQHQYFARGADRNVQSSARNPSRTPHSQREHLKERRSDPGNTHRYATYSHQILAYFFRKGRFGSKYTVQGLQVIPNSKDRINAMRFLRIIVQNARAPMQVGTHLEQTIF